MSSKGIGPQGFGKKEHNGFWIGKPTRKKLALDKWNC